MVRWRQLFFAASGSGYQEMPPFGTNVPLPILQEGDEPAYVRIDHNEALIVDAPKDS